MINDEDIDLTVEKKFGKHWQHDRRTSDTRLKLIRQRYSSFDHLFLNRRHEIPWVRKQRELSSLTRKRIRTYQDEISDEFGSTLRSTSSNTFLMFGMDIPYNYREDILEDFFMECVGWVPFTAITRCFRCGHKLLHSQRAKSIPWHCNNCGTYTGHGNLPWERTN